AEEGYSIEAQKKMLEGFCLSKGYESYEFYIDPGYSGSNLDRPAMTALIRDIVDGLISTVAVYKLDRLSRSQKDTLYFIEDIVNKNGVDFVSLTENMDTSTPIGRAMLGIISAFAQLERENIKIRTRMGMTERVKGGFWMGGGKIPFGYDYDAVKGVLVPNSDAETVRRIYDLFLSGYSPNFIANKLNLKYERLVVQILKRKTNTGVITYNGEEYEGGHEAIVDKATFERAMEEFEKRKRGVRDSSPHLLAGLVFCGECGARMRYQKWGKKGYKLVCYSKQSSKPYLVHDPNCSAENVWADEVEDEIIRDLFGMEVEMKKEKEIKKAPSGRGRLEKKLKRLYELWSEGDDALLSVIEETKKKLERIKAEEEQERIREREAKEKSVMAKKVAGLSELWDRLEMREKRAIVRSVVERIVLKNGKINIYYHF
ncbi:MAG: recombinase family protein, partial [Clostridia bacterium]|nr:recombinase family protein [Clostridia bacterium]